MITSNKIFIFTDLHFGIHSNNQSYLNICVNTLDWVRKVCTENDIHDIVFMGDFFDSRASIDVKTLNTASEAIYKLADNMINLHLILGNHDLYLRSETSIHSLLAFSGHENIKVYDTPQIFDNIMFLPWGYGTINETIAKGFGITNNIIPNIPSNLKYVFSHHDFPPSFFMGYDGKKNKRKSDTYISTTPYADMYGMQNDIVKTVIDNDGIIFSGHIHQRKEIPIGDKNSKIIIEGSPYETSWGFSDDCGGYILDLKSGVYSFISNPYNKKHVEIAISDVDINNFGEYAKNIDFGNSIIRLNVNIQSSFDTISKLQTLINSKKPYTVENTKYDFTAAEFVGKRDLSNPIDGITQKTSSKLDYINNIIDSSDLSSFSYIKSDKSYSIDKEKLKTIAADLFESVKG